MSQDDQNPISPHPLLNIALFKKRLLMQHKQHEQQSPPQQQQKEKQHRLRMLLSSVPGDENDPVAEDNEDSTQPTDEGRAGEEESEAEEGGDADDSEGEENPFCGIGIDSLCSPPSSSFGKAGTLLVLLMHPPSPLRLPHRRTQRSSSSPLMGTLHSLIQALRSSRSRSSPS